MDASSLVGSDLVVALDHNDTLVLTGVTAVDTGDFIFV